MPRFESGVTHSRWRDDDDDDDEAVEIKQSVGGAAHILNWLDSKRVCDAEERALNASSAQSSS